MYCWEQCRIDVLLSSVAFVVLWDTLHSTNKHEDLHHNRIGFLKFQDRRRTCVVRYISPTEFAHILHDFCINFEQQ